MTASGLERFGVAEHGVRWALSKLPGDLAVTLAEFPGAKGADDWSLRFGRAGVTVRSNSAVGTIAAALELGTMLREGRRENVVRHLKFRTRNYKHEIRLDGDRPHAILEYTDAMWEALIREIVSRQFNGLVHCHYRGHGLDIFHLVDSYSQDIAVNRRLPVHCPAFG